MLAVWNDPAFVHFVGDRGIRTQDEAREALQEGAVKLWEDYGYGPFRVALQQDDTPIGICGLFRRDGIEDPDVGFATLPDHCGRGFGFEAASAVLEHTREVLGLPRLIAIVSPENAASVGLIRKLGLQFERMHRMAGDDHEVAIYGIQLNGRG